MPQYTKDTVHNKEELRAYVRQIAPRYHIHPDIAEALLSKESNYGQSNYNDEGGGIGARGPFQIRGPAAKDMGVTDPDTLFDPAVNANVGLGYLQRLIGKFGIRGGLAAYNQGAGGVQGSPSQQMAGLSYADDVLGRMQRIRQMGGPLSPMNDTYMPQPQNGIMSVFPGMEGLLNWIGQGEGTPPDFQSMISDASGREQSAAGRLDQAGAGLDTSAIQQQMDQTQPPASGDFMNRLFSNLGSALTGNPMFAQAALQQEHERDTARRSEIVRKNITAYERAANEYERAGNYTQAVKMRQAEYAERVKHDQVTARAELGSQAVRAFGDIQDTYVKMGLQMDENGMLKVIGKGVLSKGVAMKREDWQKSMTDIDKALADANSSKNVNKNYPEVRAQLMMNKIALAGTPSEGMSAGDLWAQMAQYAPWLAPKDLTDNFMISLRRNPNLEGAEAYFKLAGQTPPKGGEGTPKPKVEAKLVSAESMEEQKLAGAQSVLDHLEELDNRPDVDVPIQVLTHARQQVVKAKKALQQSQDTKMRLSGGTPAGGGGVSAPRNP